MIRFVIRHNLLRKTRQTMGSTQKRIESFFVTSQPSTKRIKTATAVQEASKGGDTDVHQKQSQELQDSRTRANKNQALCKQIILQCETHGTLPELADLLVEPSWSSLLQDQLTAPYIKKDLQSFIESEWSGKAPVFPPKDAIFRALNSCPLEKVKVVILGQVRAFKSTLQTDLL